MNQNSTSSLVSAYVWVILAYALCLGVGIYYFATNPEQAVVYRLFWADVIATVIIFIFSLWFKNSSFYDPYWSLIPPLLAIGFWLDAGYDQFIYRHQIVWVLVLAWGMRLTINWMRGWQGLHHEDWRYVELQKQHGRWYWLVSFSGIHMLPTILVFLGCVPLWSSMGTNTAPLNWIDGIAALVTFVAIWIEAASDEQLWKFRKTNTNPKNIMKVGLWAYSRHPNYFGEIMFWWGLFFFALSEGWQNYWMGIGALSITLLFVFISVPMIDKRMIERRPHYQDHMRKVSGIIPWFPKA